MTKTSWMLIAMVGLMAFLLGGVVAIAEDTMSPASEASVRSHPAAKDQGVITTALASPEGDGAEPDKKDDRGSGHTHGGLGHAYGHDKGKGHANGQGKGNENWPS